MVRKDLITRFAHAGLAQERLLLEGFNRREEGYFAAFNRVDLCLDPFPFTGGTTTLDSLWMGVPVVSLRGDRMVARQGEAILAKLNLAEWVAADCDDYVRIASNAMNNRVALAESRTRIRDRLVTSDIANAHRVANDFGSALRQLWQTTCD